MDNLINSTLSEELGDAARLLCSWLDGILEFTILKHEVIVLRLKNQKVLEQIKAVSKLWPKRKEFIEGAYKILLFTKNQRKQVTHAILCLKNWNPVFLNFDLALNRILKVWYEQRIQEETAKNLRLRQLHDDLTRKKIEQQHSEMNVAMDTQNLICGDDLPPTDINEERKQALQDEINYLKD